MKDDEALAAKIAECQKLDEEDGHIKADELVIAKLRALGYEKSADAWRAVFKWYS